MNWVVDFAVGAREMIAYINGAEPEDPNGDKYADLSAEEQILYTKAVITDYGYHIMKIENVYNQKSIINMDDITAQFSLENGSEYVTKVIEKLKQSYVCASSNQTLYDYFYDEAYDTLVGSASSAGTYFLNLEYQWLSEYYEDDKIKMIEKVKYSELFESIA